MNRVLLDTHALLWFLFDDPRLSPTASMTIENRRVAKLLSLVSLWEIVIKSQIGKINLGMELAVFFDQYVNKSELQLIDIELGHLLAYDALPLVHRDPFDRLLVAKAQVMNVPILSADPLLASYDIKTVW